MIQKNKYWCDDHLVSRIYWHTVQCIYTMPKFEIWNHHQHLLVEYVRVTRVLDPSLNDEKFHRSVSWNNIFDCLPNCERIFDTFLSSIFVRLFGAPLFAKKCQHNTPRIMRKILNSYAAIQTRTTPGFAFVGGIKRSAGSKFVLQTWLTQLE